MSNELVAFLIALAASLGLTIPIRRLAFRFGMVDQPGPRKVHLKPMPLLGGLAIFSGFVLAALIAVHTSARSQIIGILAGATLLAVVGFLDDGGLLHHQVKLFVGMPAAAVFLLASGIRVRLLSAVFSGTLGTILDVLLTLFWVIGVTAAFSILDHMDGLCAGIAAIGAAYFAIAAGWNGQVLVRTLAAAVLGAALGFLRWNFNPAKIFMGDGGAMLLGFLMATLGLKLRPEQEPWQALWLAPILFLAVPVFDTLLVSISRVRRGLLPFTAPGKDHTAHRLANLGLGQRGAVLALYGIAAVAGAIGLCVIRLPASKAYAIGGLGAFCALLAILFLEGAPFERQPKLPKTSPSP